MAFGARLLFGSYAARATAALAIDDDALVCACATGDLSALGALYDRHHRVLHSFLHRLTGSSGNDMDDLVHDTFSPRTTHPHDFSAYDASARFRAALQSGPGSWESP